MSGIEFRVGRTDHHKVEEFLSADIPGVHGIRIDASNLRIHAEAAEAARHSPKGDGGLSPNTLNSVPRRPCRP